MNVFLESIFADYKDRYYDPQDGKPIEDYYLNEANELIIVFEDGSKELFDPFDKTIFQVCKSRDEWGQPYDDEVWKRQFGCRLYKMIRGKGYTLEEFAEEAEISQAALSHYVNFRTFPDVFKLKQMADILGCDIGFFINLYK